MGAPASDSEKRLVDDFDQNREVFLTGDYKEKIRTNLKGLGHGL
jgi:hypothetical protein